MVDDVMDIEEDVVLILVGVLNMNVTVVLIRNESVIAL